MPLLLQAVAAMRAKAQIAITATDQSCLRFIRFLLMSPCCNGEVIVQRYCPLGGSQAVQGWCGSL